LNWLRRRSLGEEWSQRYGDHWAQVKALIAKSWRRGIAWAGAGAMCVALVAVGLLNQGWIRRQVHEFRNIEPFAKQQVRPFVLDAAREKSLQPFATFSECAASSMCPEMVVIPPGPFVMGSDTGSDNERPPHAVEIKSRLAVGKYEVTNAQWTTCIDHGWCRENGNYGKCLSRSAPSNQPVGSIPWVYAQDYVDWLSQMTGKEYRLPSEAEWEYVARAGTTTPYYWGNGQELGRGNANCDGCGNRDDDKGPRPVGQFSPNAFGLYDTRGNVWELTADTWHDDYQGAPTDGSVWGGGSDPDHHIARGGSYSSHREDLTASYRFRQKSTDTYPGTGFRVVRTLDSKPTDVKSTEMKPVSRRATSDPLNTCQPEQPN
jgi:formylglycine-generating enzyme required for sulfatase activity